MLVYFVLFLYLIFIFWLVHHLKIRNTGWLMTITFLIFFLVAGFRHYTVGSDTGVYRTIFESKMEIPPLSEYFNSRFELGFLYLNDFIYNNITIDYSIYLAIYSFFTLAITFFVIKKESKDAYLSLIIYFGFGIFTLTMSNIRGSLAMAFVYLAYRYIERNKNIRGIFSILVASSFHISSLVFLVAFLFRKIRIGKIGLFITAVLGFAGYVGARIIIERVFNVFTKYGSYLDSTWYNDSGKLGVILGFIIILLVFLFGEYVFQSVELTKSENFLRNIMLLATVTSFISIQTALLGRFSGYFANFIILYIPLIVNKINANDFVMKRRKVITVLTIILLFGIRFFVILILKPEWNVIVPYRTTLIELFFNF